LTAPTGGAALGYQELSLSTAAEFWFCHASRDGNDASDPPEHDKPDIDRAVSMIA
jgi:hypothetical protein